MDETAAHATALSENKLVSRLLKIVTELDLDRRDFVIFGSGPLLAHGLRQRISDLDVVARGSVWQRVSEYGCPGIGSLNGAPDGVVLGRRASSSPAAGYRMTGTPMT